MRTLVLFLGVAIPSFLVALSPLIGSAHDVARNADQAGIESVYDRAIPALMEKWGVPGGAVAIAKDGRLAFTKGYGVSDSEAAQPAQPDQLWRIASNSKPITAVAILQLVEEGRLDLDAQVFDLLRDLAPPEGVNVDPRIAQVTVHQLLWHVGGWDRE